MTDVIRRPCLIAIKVVVAVIFALAFACGGSANQTESVAQEVELAVTPKSEDIPEVTLELDTTSSPTPIRTITPTNIPAKPTETAVPTVEPTMEPLETPTPPPESVDDESSEERKEPISEEWTAEKDYAAELFSAELTANLLNGLIRWPMGFDECISNSISRDRLDMFRVDINSIDGRDKDAAAICLLSIELNYPGSTDYLRNMPEMAESSTDRKPEVKTEEPKSHGESGGSDQLARQEGIASENQTLDINDARQLYSPELSTNLLNGLIEWPPGFEQCVNHSIGKSKLDAFRSDIGSVSGMDKDSAALCLLSIELSHPGSTDHLKNASVSPGMAKDESQNVDGEVGGGDPGSGNEIRNQAQELFGSELYGNMSNNILTGSASAPEGFDDCISAVLGDSRLADIRDVTSSLTAEARDRDEAMVCLFTLGYQPGDLILSTIPVQSVSSVYEFGGQPVSSGVFKSGQNADLVIGAIGFNQTGGPLSFNHPSGIATDGVRLLMADSYNNRVLIWNELPTGNEAPDIVLGQNNFFTNAPGTGRDNMNWPKSVATDGTKIVITDTYNDRILIWNEFPTENGTEADIVLQGFDTGTKLTKDNLLWPWGVWTDGEKLVITSTKQSGILIWNTFPTYDNESADILLTGNGALGTPRQITSDGESLIVGDHNATVDGNRGVGTFFWKTFPDRDEQQYDFYLSDPIDLGTGAPWMRGDFTDEGKLLLLGSALYVWDSFPEDANVAPNLSVIGGYEKWGASFLKATDHTTLTVAGERVFITTNLHTISVYNSIPISEDQKPDLVIGGPDIYTNMLQANHFIMNPIPASDGNSLFVASDAGYFYVWKNIPDESGVAPDYIYSVGPDSIAFSVGDVTLYEDTLILGGRDMLLKWDQLPLEGQAPDLLLKGQIGSVQIGNVSNESLGITGIAMDSKYFYMGLSTDEIYIWEGFPEDNAEPVTVLRNIRALNLHSDGTYLVASNGDRHTVTVYRVADILTNPTQNVVGRSGINGANGVYVGDGQLFIADNGFGRVHVWNDIEDAISGRPADALLGNISSNTPPQIGINKLFLPKFLTYDGKYLWVGEVKFSNRLLRFSRN